MRLSLVTSLVAAAVGVSAAPLNSAKSSVARRDVTAPFSIQLVSNGDYNGTYLSASPIPGGVNVGAVTSCSNVPDASFTFEETDTVGQGLGKLSYAAFNQSWAANYGPMDRSHPNNYPIEFGGPTAVEVFELDTDSYIRIKLEHAAGFYICPYTPPGSSVSYNALQWNNYAPVANFTGCTSVQLLSVS